jgi:hypothetical protein
MIRVAKILGPGSGSASKNSITLNQKTNTKFSNIKYRMSSPNPGFGFFPIQEHGSGSRVKKAPDLDQQHCKIT